MDLSENNKQIYIYINMYLKYNILSINIYIWILWMIQTSNLFQNAYFDTSQVFGLGWFYPQIRLPKDPWVFLWHLHPRSFFHRVYPWKMDGWKTSRLPFEARYIFRGELLNFEWVTPMLPLSLLKPQEPSVEFFLDHLMRYCCMISCHTGWWVAVSTMRYNNPSDRG